MQFGSDITCDRKERSMIITFLAKATERMELLITELGKTVGRANIILFWEKRNIMSSVIEVFHEILMDKSRGCKLTS